MHRTLATSRPQDPHRNRAVAERHPLRGSPLLLFLLCVSVILVSFPGCGTRASEEERAIQAVTFVTARRATVTRTVNLIGMVYGDAEDPEFCSELPLRHARWIICATPQASAQIYLLKALRGHGYRGKVATTAYHEADVERLANAGSDVVLRPFAYAAKESAEELLRLG